MVYRLQTFGNDPGAGIEFAFGPDGLSDAMAEAAALELAAYLVKHVPAEILKRLPDIRPKRGRSRPKPDEIPERGQLDIVLTWWNRLRDEGIVSHAVDGKRPGAEIVRAWRVFLEDSQLREWWADLDRIERELRASTLCREGWCRLEKLLRGATNRDGLPLIKKLIEGGFRDGKRIDAAEPFRAFVARARN